MFLVWQISNTKSKTTGFWFICRTMMTLLPVAGLVGSNNLSTAVIILGIGVLLIFVANPDICSFSRLEVRGQDLLRFFLPRRVIVWNAWQSGGIRKNMKKDFRLYRACMQSEAEGSLARGSGTVCRSWDLSRKPRMI